MNITNFIGIIYHTTLQFYTWIQKWYHFFFMANTQNKIYRNANLFTSKHKKENISKQIWKTQNTKKKPENFILDANVKFTRAFRKWKVINHLAMIAPLWNEKELNWVKLFYYWCYYCNDIYYHGFGQLISWTIQNPKISREFSCLLT